MGLDTKVTTEESYEAGFTEISYPRVKNCAYLLTKVIAHKGSKRKTIRHTKTLSGS